MLLPSGQFGLQAPKDPEHQTWLKQFERGWGGARWERYVPAVTGNGNGMSEYSDLDRPDIMERRAALWARESVRGLGGMPIEDDAVS